MSDPSPPESPVLRLVRRIAAHADVIYMDADRNGDRSMVTFADLDPDDQADVLVEWLDRVLGGWDGPTAVARDPG